MPPTIWFGVLQAATLAARPRAALPPPGRLHRPHLHVRQGPGASSAASTASSASTRAPSRPGRPTCAACSSFSAVGVLFVYALQRFQAVLPYSLGLPAVPEGLVVQHRGLVRHEHQLAVVLARAHPGLHRAARRPRGAELRLGGRRHRGRRRARPRLRRAAARARSATSGSTSSAGIVRLLLPLSIVAAIALHRRRGRAELQRLHRGRRPSPAARRSLPGGPVASQEAIKELGTNGGGFFNANSAHPFENPTPWTSLFEILLLLAIPVRHAARVRPHGRRQPAGLRDPRARWRTIASSRSPLVLVARSARPGHRAAARRRRDGGQGDALRHPRLDAVRRRHHAHLDRRRQLDARLATRRSAA